MTEWQTARFNLSDFFTARLTRAILSQDWFDKGGQTRGERVGFFYCGIIYPLPLVAVLIKIEEGVTFTEIRENHQREGKNKSRGLAHPVTSNSSGKLNYST